MRNLATLRREEKEEEKSNMCLMICAAITINNVNALI